MQLRVAAVVAVVALLFSMAESRLTLQGYDNQMPSFGPRGPTIYVIVGSAEQWEKDYSTRPVSLTFDGTSQRFPVMLEGTELMVRGIEKAGTSAVLTLGDGRALPVRSSWAVWVL
eukprot:m.153785 g.153785  ORF g.153785 m.153785 type:complete len:115 (+) comp20768_c3_seq1:204-548(+)